MRAGIRIRMYRVGFAPDPITLVVGYSLHHSGHLTLWGVRVAFTMVR
jgi:hypothetical protein